MLVIATIPCFSLFHDSGDIRDFISKYGATEHLVSVDKEKSIITNNTNDGYSVGGIIMKREMKKKWNYFEVELTAADEDGAIGIGIGHEKYQLYNMPGWEADSIGYHSDDGGLFHEAGFPSLHGPTCTIGDRMGCGVDFTHSDDGHVRVWFTKNGEVVIKPQVVELPAHPSSNFYPLICMQKPGQKAQYMGHWKEVPPTEDDGKPTVCLHTCRGISGHPCILCVCMCVLLVLIAHLVSV